jgi:Uma2 family endonuclease
MSQPLVADLDEPIEVDIADLITEDEAPVDNLFSEKQQRLLTEPLYSSWAGPKDDEGNSRKFLASANVGLFPTVHEPPLVPDVFLSLDVEVADNWYEKRHRTYFFWEFGKAPEVVIEIVSNRKGNELGAKLTKYARIGVRYYVVFDPYAYLVEEKVRVFELYVDRYQQRTDWMLPRIGLGLILWQGVFEGKNDTWLRWCEENGNPVLTGAELAACEAARARQEMDRANREADRADREADRADREMQRAEALAAKLRELGIEADQNR